jgi:hypothetical protein
MPYGYLHNFFRCCFLCDTLFIAIVISHSENLMFYCSKKYGSTRLKYLQGHRHAIMKEAEGFAGFLLRRDAPSAMIQA